MSCLGCGAATDIGAGYGPCEACAATTAQKEKELVAGEADPPAVFVAWTESLLPNVNPLDRVGLIVERDAFNAALSLHCEIEESGPEVGKPARTRVLHPVTRYVPETEVKRLAAALDQIVDLLQGDLELFDTVYGIAHDALRRCPGCFLDGKRIK